MNEKFFKEAQKYIEKEKMMCSSMKIYDLIIINLTIQETNIEASTQISQKKSMSILKNFIGIIADIVTIGMLISLFI